MKYLNLTKLWWSGIKDYFLIILLIFFTIHLFTDQSRHFKKQDEIKKLEFKVDQLKAVYENKHGTFIIWEKK